MTSGWVVLLVLVVMASFALVKWVVSDRIAELAYSKGLDGDAIGIVVLIVPLTTPFVWLWLKNRPDATRPAKVH